MTKSLISLNDLFAGMKLEGDVLDQFHNPLLKKGTVLSEDDLTHLTALQQAYFIYSKDNKQREHERQLLLSLLNDYLRTVTFIEACGINLNDLMDNYYPPPALLEESAWEEDVSRDYIKEAAYAFIHLIVEAQKKSGEDRGANEYIVSVTEQLALHLYEVWKKGSIKPYEFYLMCSDRIKMRPEQFGFIVDRLLVPFPEGSTVLLKDGESYEVMHVNQDEPFKPVLRKREGERVTYFAEDITYEVETVKPIAIPNSIINAGDT